MEPNLRLRLDLPSLTPVVGVPIQPSVHLLGAPNHSLLFNWYRLWNDREFYCSVHHFKKATLQCTTCLSFNVLDNLTYHCTAKCYHDSWDIHRARHHQVATNLNTTTTLDLDDSWKSIDYNYVIKKDPSPDMVDQQGKSWITLASSKIYTPSMDDLGCILRLDYQVIHFPSTKQSLVTDRVLGFPVPRPRRMIKVNHQPQDSFHAPFRVLSYNILADMYATVVKYSYCPTWALTWEYRKKNLLREILGYEADILCLQEVQSDHFRMFLQPRLEERGYTVIYEGKKNKVFTSNGPVVDGCVTCYRCNRFREVCHYQLVFSEIAQEVIVALQPSERLQLTEKKIDPIRLTKDNVAIVTILEFVDNTDFPDKLSYRFCVVNTHVHANEDFKDVKLWQVATLVGELEKIDCLRIPVLVCGDFNSLPGSAAHDLLLKAKVDLNLVDLANDPLGLCRRMKLSHDMPLVSAYASFLTADSSDPLLEKQRENMNSESGEPRFTNFTKVFSGTLDYIFYTANRFTVKGLLELLALESVENTALPSPEWSSDHVALVADFWFRPSPHGGEEANCPLPDQLL